MNNWLKIRKRIFENLLEHGKNKRNWEMLCCSGEPFVPFIGAGMSAWCYPTWNDLLENIVAENFSKVSADIVRKALNCKEEPNFSKPKISNDSSKFHWMEEIAECIFDDNEDSYNKNVENFELKSGSTTEADRLLQQLRYYVGEESVDKKRMAVKALHKAFDSLLISENKMPEYQNYFHRLFQGVLITTNYDKALEKCYPSLFSYSYKDLNEEYSEKNESWLYRAVTAKIIQMKDQLEEKSLTPADVTIPDIPMLLKVHGSIEHASGIALPRKGYDDAYRGEMPELIREIFKNTTVIFLGYSLREDRIMYELKKAKKEAKEVNKKMPRHFAFLPGGWGNDEDWEDKLENVYGVYPIFYDQDTLPTEMCKDEDDRNNIYHDYCLGLFMENLLRRKMYYSQPLELLWDDERYKEETTSELIERTKKRIIVRQNFAYVRREEASQIWRLLNSSEECPLIAITGEYGSGRSTLCQSMMELQDGYKDTLQFFYISVAHCKSWEEFCIQTFQQMNIVVPDIPGQGKWRDVAEIVHERCGEYWKSVLIFDHIDGLKDIDVYPNLWESVKHMFRFWKKHQIRVIFVCQEYPRDISCYTWHVGELNSKDVKKVFFSTCISGRYRDITYLEHKVIDELVSRQTFKTSTIELLGVYANSKSDLTSLLEEWELYYLPGDTGEQTVARILWKHLLDEHKYEQQPEKEQRAIEENILWIWGILGDYPGRFPSEFFESYLKSNTGQSYKDKELSEKTLIYMKNIGLCEETEDENQNNLLENMVKCVNEYFLKNMCGNDDKYKEMEVDFQRKTGVNGKKGELHCGLRDFRGYVMHFYQAELGQYIFHEVMGEAEKEDNSIDEILVILEFISEKVKNDEIRMYNRKLNLVLHYEIKTVIRFLTSCLRYPERRKRVTEIAYDYSHFYHYAPQHAYPLVKRLLSVMEENREELYKRARMNRVLGDILRLMGRKKESMNCYSRAVDLSNIYMVKALEKQVSYKECIRIKAGALLACCYGIDDEDRSKITAEESRKLYEKIQDQWGMAYYNQRKGEMLSLMGEGRQNEFDKISTCYNDAIRLYTVNNDKTGVAYILKCMGDLLTIYKEKYELQDNHRNRKYSLRNITEDGREFYQIVKNEGSDSKNTAIIDTGEDWQYAAAQCYIQSFYCYYTHINWRGFANVIQALGTCYRTRGVERTFHNIKAVEELYGLAEECYRWLGDARGLADTLDYFGYGYREVYDKRCNATKTNLEEVCRYMALSKWMESRSIWEKLCNEAKSEQTRNEIEKLLDK